MIENTRLWAYKHIEEEDNAYIGTTTFTRVRNQDGGEDGDNDKP